MAVVAAKLLFLLRLSVGGHFDTSVGTDAGGAGRDSGGHVGGSGRGDGRVLRLLGLLLLSGVMTVLNNGRKYV